MFPNVLEKYRTKCRRSYPEWFTTPKDIHLQSNPLGRRYTSASIRVTYGNTAGNHFLRPLVTPPTMLLSPHSMTQNGVPVNVFSMMRTDKSHTELSLVNRGGCGSTLAQV
ncbi:hypothetical protein TNCV_2489431 [Trichonephila clavipes]|nr:hypothetical protein TNCV_2489431 [Trichonephila clavipes]